MFVLRFCIGLWMLCLPVALVAQDMVKYTQGFRFKDGIYLSFDDFRNNSPSIPLSQLYLSNGSQAQDVFERNQAMYVKNEVGELKKVKEYWGYSKNGRPYIEDERVLVVGALTHFTRQETTTYYDPYMQTHISSGTTLAQYILDFSTGDFIHYTLRNFEALLERDPPLYEEFMSIKRKRKRKKKMFMFLRKYNERNPIYFPE